jgi:hypothetical protein
VSIDLAVWEGPRPASDRDARATFEDLSRRLLGGDALAPPTERIVKYVETLLRRYPDLSDDDELEVPWGSGPLIGNASGPIVYIDMKLNDAFEAGWRFCVETAEAQGLVAFDPQSGELANADPTAAPRAVPALPPRPGPVYRWLSLRSWRWPFLRPLLPLARRFSRNDER